MVRPRGILSTATAKPNLNTMYGPLLRQLFKTPAIKKIHGIWGNVNMQWISDDNATELLILLGVIQSTVLILRRLLKYSEMKCGNDCNFSSNGSEKKKS